MKIADANCVIQPVGFIREQSNVIARQVYSLYLCLIIFFGG